MTSYLYFDTETTGLPRHYSDYKMAGQPELVQLAMELYIDNSAKPVYTFAALCSDIEHIPEQALAVHGKTVEMCHKFGLPRENICSSFLSAFEQADYGVCHNAQYDILVVAKALWTAEREVPDRFYLGDIICTQMAMTPVCKLPGSRGGYKWPKLQEAHQHCFGEPFDGAHDALADIRATRRVHLWLLEQKKKASPKPPALTQPIESSTNDDRGEARFRQ